MGTLLGLIVLAGTFSPFLSTAGALSDYGITITDEAHVGGESSNGNCKVTDMTDRWTELMSSDPADEWSYKNTLNYKRKDERQKLDAFRQYFIDNQAINSGWMVTVVDGEVAGVGAGNKMVRIVLFDPSQNVDIVQNGIQFSVSAKVTTFMVNPNNNCRFQAWEVGKNYWHMGVGVNAKNSVLLAKSEHVVYPSDYSGDQLPTSPPSPRNYVALGDSFSSGEGNPPFEPGTENTCHRSSFAYPRLLELSRHISLTDFAACSGATTEDVANGGAEEQVAFLSQDTDIVTITIGGNDIKFKDLATACTISLCDFSTQAYQNAHNNITNNLQGKLIDTYAAIDNATSSSAEIYVLGYPHLAPSEMPTGSSSVCWPLNGGANNQDPTQNNGAAVYSIQTQLNTTIQQAVADYGSSKFHYIDPNGENSPFLGHDWCSQDRYFQVIALNALEYSYHPNIEGHEAYTKVMIDRLSQ